VSKRPAVWAGSLALVFLTGCLLVGLHLSNDSDADAAVPKWASHCFTRPVSVTASDMAYVGLTRKAAAALAAQRGQRLVVFGADNRCMAVAGVALERPVAVAFDIGSERGIPSSAKIVFASADAGLAFQGN
jgi:hypothetical protein